MKNVEMPKMGDTMEEGKILRWIKQEGDPVKKGEPLAEVETDKVNIEIEAFASGTLRKILVPAGQSAPIGAPIAFIGAPDEPLPSHLGGNGAQTSVSMSPSTPRARTQHAHGSQAASPGTVTEAPSIHIPLTDTSGRIFISPIARRIAQEHHLDYSGLRGTGPNGRIIKMDIEAALQRQQTTVAAPAAQPVQPTTEPAPAPVAIDTGEVVEIPLTA